jgi:hypothetical protein
MDGGLLGRPDRDGQHQHGDDDPGHPGCRLPFFAPDIVVTGHATTPHRPAIAN